MMGEFFLDHGKPARLTQRIVRASLVFVICSVVVGIGVSELENARRLNGWHSTPCEIIGSDVESVGKGYNRTTPYHLNVSYRYEVSGHRFSKIEQPEANGYAEAAEAYALARYYTAGLRTVCYLNPLGGSDSKLTRPSLVGTQLFVAGAVLVELIGLFGYCIPQVFFYKPKRRKTPNQRSEVISGSLLFLGFGAICVYWYCIPVAQEWKSRNWVPVKATVIESNIIKSEGGGEVHIVSFHTDIHYRYQFNGIDYHSNCYNLTEGETVFGAFREKFVRAYPAGRQLICYLNQNDPQIAVLSRHISPGIFNGTWTAGPALLGLVGVLTGGTGDRFKAFFSRFSVALGAISVLCLLGFIWGQVGPP